MFGRFNKLIYLLFFITFISCGEKNLDPIYKEIPAQYSYVFEHIRSVDDTNYVLVKSNTGLFDQLSFSVDNAEKRYREIFTTYEIPGARDQQFYAEIYTQTLTPSIYNFYSFNYKIDLVSTNKNVVLPEDSENYYARISISNQSLLSYNLTNNTISCEFPYDVLSNYTVNNKVYPTVYRINISTPAIYRNIKTVYFTLSSGVVQFETVSGEIFDMIL